MLCIMKGWCCKSAHTTFHWLRYRIKQLSHAQTYCMHLLVPREFSRSWLDVFPQANGNTGKSWVHADRGEGARRNSGRCTREYTKLIKDSSFWCWARHSFPKFYLWPCIHSLSALQCNASAIIRTACNKWAYPVRIGYTRIFGDTLRKLTSRLDRGINNQWAIKRNIPRRGSQRCLYLVDANTSVCASDKDRIKLLTMAFIKWLLTAKKRLLFNDINTEGVRVSLYAAEVERLINRSILGTEDDPCQ